MHRKVVEMYSPTKHIDYHTNWKWPFPFNRIHSDAFSACNDLFADTHRQFSSMAHQLSKQAGPWIVLWSQLCRYYFVMIRSTIEQVAGVESMIFTFLAYRLHTIHLNILCQNLITLIAKSIKRLSGEVFYFFFSFSFKSTETNNYTINRTISKFL